MKKLNGKIDLEQEFDALFEFIELRWNVKQGLKDLLHKVWSKGLELYADTAESEGRVANKIADFYDSKENYISDSLTETEKSTVLFLHPYSIFSLTLLQLNFSNALKYPIDLHYCDIERIMKGFLSNYPKCADIKPRGWIELEKNYTDYAGMDDYNENADKNVFNGTDIEPNNRSFVLRISLPQVMYDEIGQGNEAIVVLMMAVVDHARKCISHNNALDFLKEIEKVENYFFKLKDVSPMPFDLSLENVTDHKILIQVFEEAKNNFVNQENFKR